MSNEFRTVVAILLGCCAACSERASEQQTRIDTTTQHAPAQQPFEPPSSKTDSIRIEGTWQPIELELVRPQSSIPFLTYAPADMIAESKTSDEGEAHFFYANFGGKRNNEAYLLMFVLPAGTSEEDAIRLAREFKSSHQRSGFVVSTELRRHGDRYYYIAEQYPAEYGDGFGPRSQKIQQEWKWLD